MATAKRTIYQKNKKGRYKKIDIKIDPDFPTTAGRWEQEKIFGKKDGYKVNVKYKKSRSGLSKVPEKVTTIFKDGTKYVYTDIKRSKRKWLKV